MTKWQLIEEAISFATERGHSSMFLLSVDMLCDAAKLYNSIGFKIAEEKAHKIWGVDLTEQRYEMKL